MGQREGQRDARLRWPGTATLVATTAVCGAFGWFAMWSSSVGSDEGYLLISLREWVTGGHLYDQVYTQYGPFYYAVFGLPARVLGAEWTIATGRVTTLAVWLATTLLLGVAVRRITGRVSFAVAAQVVVFSLLWVLVNEPMHPGGLLCLLLGAMVANVAIVRPRHLRASDLLTGCLLAAMLLTKINIGGFALVAVAFAALSTLRSGHARLWRSLGDAALLGLGPLLLLSGGNESNRLALAVLYLCGAGLVVIASRAADHRSMPEPTFDFIAAGVGAAVVGLAIALVAIATRTSIGSLIDGIAIRPLEQPDALNVPIPMPGFVWLWIVALPVAVILARGRTLWPQSRRAQAVSGAVRVVGGLTLVASVFGKVTLGPYHPDGTRFVLLPLAALVLVPMLADTPSSAGGLFARRVLGALAVTQSLHAYPVPGSQVAWSLFLAGVCGVIVVSDGVTELIGANTLHSGNRPGVAVALGAAAAIAIPLMAPFGVSQASYPGRQLVGWWKQYHREIPLSLAGTGPVRMPRPETVKTRGLATELRRNCDTFVAYSPLFISFYVLSGVQPPTGLNPTIYDLLTREEQQAVVDQLRRTRSRVCLLIDPLHATVTPLPSGAGHAENRVKFFPGIDGMYLARYLELPRWVHVATGDGYQILRRAPT